MFLDREMTPELAEELLKQHIIIANSENEAYQKAKQIKESGELLMETVTIEAVWLNHILRNWKGVGTQWSALKGMRVLDLASGSGYSHDYFGDIWYPQFGRLCAFNRAEVTVIDIHPQKGFDQELFTWADADLIQVTLNGGLPSLPILQGRTFDLINSSNFIGYNYCPELPKQCAHHKIQIREFESLLLSQTRPLLDERGFLSLGQWDEKHHSAFYVKKEGRVIPQVESF